MAGDTQTFEEHILPKIARIATIFFAITFVISVGLLAWRVLPLVYGRDNIPLHYNIYVGIDALGPWWMLFVTPAIAFVLACGNAICATWFFKKQPILGIAAWSTTFLVSIFALLSVLHIVLINIAYG